MGILQIGSTVNNYKIVKILGQDQLGETYLGQQQLYNPLTGKPMSKGYTIKTINLFKAAQLGLNSATIEAEAKVLKQMSSNPICDKYISCYYNYFTMGSGEEQYLIIITDYVHGQNLQQIILNQASKGNFKMPELLKIMVEIAQAVDYIHEHGVAHQNIKPSNIIYDSAVKRLKLVDFSFSCSLNLNSQCKGKAGTAYYMPPELLSLSADPSTLSFDLRKTHDIWSMGVVFYQLANRTDFMQFTNNDPSLVAKEIQINNVKESTYPYTPINSIISTMLNKNYSERPTSGQVVILLQLARPLCIVNDYPYNRIMAEALVTSLGMDTDPDIDDYSLCKKLTDYLKMCKIKEAGYQKDHLLKLANILGINVTPNIESALLCETIQNGLKISSHYDDYSSHVTEEILRAIEYLSFIIELAKSNSSDLLVNIQKQLQTRYASVYSEAKKLGLLNLKMLESRRSDVTRKSLVYQQNASIAYSRVYALIAQNIAQTIADNNPNAEVGGVPIIEFQRKILQPQ